MHIEQDDTGDARRFLVDLKERAHLLHYYKRLCWLTLNLEISVLCFEAALCVSSLGAVNPTENSDSLGVLCLLWNNAWRARFNG
jgi:hypothetical protein